MNDKEIKLPKFYESVFNESNQIGFSMSSDKQTGSFLRTLVASKPNGKFLDLGTGTGISLSWIIEAMDNKSHVISVDNNELYLCIAKKYFDKDHRVSLICQDGNDWIKSNQDKSFDLIFADSIPGKYECLDETLNLLKIGAFYFIDDMLKRPNWPKGHQENVDNLINNLESRNDLRVTKINWSTGLILVTKYSPF